MKQLEKFTLGKSPAAIYLVSILNQSTNNNDRIILKHISFAKKSLNEIKSAWEKGILSRDTMLEFCNLKRKEIQLYQNDKLTPLVLNLYKNLLLANIKHMTRTDSKIEAIVKSAVSRGRDLLKNENLPLIKNSVDSYGKVTRKSIEKFPVNISYDEFGTMNIKKNFDLNNIKDEINDESLLNKFIAKHKAKGKDYGIKN